MSLLCLDNLTVKRGNCPVVDDVSVEVGPGECIGLIGPNGAGKTTLMRGALGLLPHSGRSSLTEVPLSERARACAWMPQNRDIAWPMSVQTLVALGRIPHLPKGQRLKDEDEAAIASALEKMRLEGFSQRIATELSGGEQARVLIARALAQETPLLMADEPIAGLDPAGQIATMQVFRRLADEGHAVIVSLHDLGLAVRHCTRLLLLSEGRLVSDGAPRAVLTETNLRQVFGVSAFFQETENGLVFQPLEKL